MNDVPVIPDWMKCLPNNAMIGTVEIAQIYGINRSSITRCIERGTVLKPLMSVKRGHGPDAFKWRLGDVRKHLTPNAS